MGEDHRGTRPGASAGRSRVELPPLYPPVSRLALLCLGLSFVGCAMLGWYQMVTRGSLAAWAILVLFLLGLFVTEVYCAIRMLRRRQEGLAYLLVAFLLTVGPCSVSPMDPPDRRHAEYAAASSCRGQMHNVWLALQAYTWSHNERLPPPGRWCDALLEAGLLDDREILRCPSSSLDSGYALNEAVATGWLMASNDTVLLFESDVGWNAAGGRELLAARPRHTGRYATVPGDGNLEWVASGGRELRPSKSGNMEGYNFLFCDGRVRWVAAADVDSLRWEP